MTTKLKFLWVLLALLVESVNEAWADTVTFGYAEGNTSIASIHSANNPSVTSGVVTFTASGATSGSNNVTQNSGKLKFQQNTYLTISVADDYIISQIVITNEKKKWELNIGSLGSIAYSGDNDKINTWTGSAQSVTFINSIASDNLNVISVEVTYAVDSRKKITRFSPEGGYNSTPSFVDNVPSSKTVSCNFAIEKDNNDKLADATLHVTSSNTDIITITSVNTQNASSVGTQRITVVYNIVTEGEAYINYVFDGDENYQPTSNSVKITTENLRLASRYNNSYPYTWDFVNNDWSSTTIQLKASDNWTAGDNSATNKYAIEAVDCYDIDIIKGLKLTAAANGITADWQNKKLTITGTVTLPDLLRGHRVTIVSSAEPSSVPANFTLKSSTPSDGKYTNVYFVSAGTTNPAITFSSATDIYSIAVEKTRAELVFSNTTSSYLKSNPPTLYLGTTQHWGNYSFNIIDGLVTGREDNPSPDYTVTITPTGILHDRYGVEWESGTTNRLVLTADAVGTAHVSVAINPSGEHGYDVVSPYEFDVRVVQNATPKKWDFENASYWSTTSGNLNSSYWVTSSDATNNPGEVMSNVAFNNTELTKDGTNKIPEMEGLVMTAVKGSSRFNIGQYYRLGNYSKASITIPSLTTGQTVTFKVETATSGKERGITATSSNLELISGQVSDKVSYFTYRVTSDGDGVFHQTSEDAGLKIYYIDLKAATPAATELKFVDGSGNDISNKQVNIVSSTTGALDSYFHLSKSLGTSWNDVTVTVDPNSLLTHDGDGTFTMGSGTGTATITARTESSSTETGIAVLYVSVKAQPTVTLSANGPFTVNYGQNFNNNTSTVTGTSSAASLTVKYRSSNERVATVNSSGVVTCVGIGTATITAYTEETNDYLPAEASYQVTYTAGNVVFQFEPSEVKLALGKNITPFLHYDQQGQLDPATVTYTLSKTGVVTCEIVTDARQSDKKIIKITSVDDASMIGETVIVTASATMRNSTTVYNTTVAVTITAEDAVNFDWVKGDDIYVYENTYFPIPGYTGNASGNNSYSNGPDNSSTHHAYLYKKDGGGTPVWNNQSYKLNEGVPNYYVNDTDKALIFWARSDKSNYPDTLLVYAKTAGTVTLHAKDSQTAKECTPITIHILAKSGLETAHTAEVNTISLPYTWDFTKDFSESDFANSMFWESMGSGRYDNTSVWMNEDWAYELGGDKFPVNFLGGTGAGSPVALFKGAQIQLGNSTYNSKIGRLQVRLNAGEGNSHLTIIGGQHYLYLPEIPVARTPNQAYRLYVKAKGQSTAYNDDGTRKDDDCSRIIVEVNNGSGGYTSLGTFVYAEETKDKKDYIVKCLYCDIPAASAGKTLRLNFDKNVELHWIALSTEAKPIYQPASTSYPASTYSYSKALDLDKSKEVETGLATYYAGEFNDGSVKTVRMNTLNGRVAENEGLMLKLSGSYEASDAAPVKQCYLIADPENMETYVAPSVLTQNFLKGTGASEKTDLGRFEKDGSGNVIATNYVFTNVYRKIVDNEDESQIEEISGAIEDDWKYVRTNGNVTVGAQKAYLQLEGRLLNLEYDTNPGSAARGILNIIFDDDDEPELTGIQQKHLGKMVTEDSWYSLQGVRVMKPARGGIYIYKGKKVVLK